MKAVILAGGLGTRLSEETTIRPKPMVEIGGMPILWHIMKIYSAHGVNEFIICCGYKGEAIKQFFVDYVLKRSDLTCDLKNNRMNIHRNDVEPWKVTLVDTGLKTMKGGRMLRVREYIEDETFFMTYGDGLSDVDIADLLNFHQKQQVLVTLTAVQPPGRFGAFRLAKKQCIIKGFKEKPNGDGAWVNGGFFVLEPEAMNYIAGDEMDWENEPMEHLARESKLAAFKHTGFWQPMDTLRDKHYLENLWSSGKPPWKVWP
ncbi:glucose-1-phosphate cytidylyltransferase [Desulfonatronovibrio magnus]|uniref:glucose-1-phosphate cytidylyltransferase n=1 Tax=Desulfonatronovibrio magnus TaxID=698827 RepID=UPI0005EB2413|nr:glucose-1-phosphate cytidylyltransferase [Desulfonatronovibrio magnus]